MFLEGMKVMMKEKMKYSLGEKKLKNINRMLGGEGFPLVL